VKPPSAGLDRVPRRGILASFILVSGTASFSEDRSRSQGPGEAAINRAKPSVAQGAPSQEGVAEFHQCPGVMLDPATALT